MPAGVVDRDAASSVEMGNSSFAIGQGADRVDQSSGYQSIPRIHGVRENALYKTTPSMRKPERPVGTND